MRSLKGLALVGVAIVLAVPAQGVAADPASVSSVYSVGAATVPGVDTGLVLTGGTVTVTATGAVCPFGDVGFCVGPAGDNRGDTTLSSFGGFVLPGAPAWALVGRVGSGPWVVVGVGPTTLSGSGVLVLAVNDDQFGDNTGSFTATVAHAQTSRTSACRPGNGYGDATRSHCGPPGKGTDCFPGYGHGDANHTHCGPPGLDGKTNGGAQQDRGAKGSEQDAPRKSGPASPPATATADDHRAPPGRSKGA